MTWQERDDTKDMKNQRTWMEWGQKALVFRDLAKRLWWHLSYICFDASGCWNSGGRSPGPIVHRHIATTKSSRKIMTPQNNPVLT